ncbi:MAG: MBL fold metallo-hydrolase [Saprospiraceae bacterium]|nr:MBL fold metallo-hydrolase [Saprospiraceae bacterium]
MKFTFLGTGTSQGVPIIGCDCTVCTSTDSRDQRLRTSGMVSFGNKNIVIDTGPDFRQQMLRAQIDDVVAILFTHDHNDHTAGLDDIRPINFKHQRSMPLYSTPSVQKSLMRRFAYALGENPYPGAPRLTFETISEQKNFEVEGLEIQPIKVWHGEHLPILGFRFKGLTYITDCKTIDSDELGKIKGTHTLVLNALHHHPHYSHLNLTEALELIEIIAPKQAFLTHISHNMGRYEDVQKILPQNVSLAYDNLCLMIPDEV